MKKQENNNMNDSSDNYDDDINLSLFFKTFLRNKLLIGTISAIFFLVGCMVSLTFKRVWQGEFQIVLNTSKTTAKINPFRSSRDNNLATEIGKLQSPSVLMPIFEFASSKGDYNNFTSWKRNLETGLVNNTSILKIVYRDTNKSLIIPILEKISDTYQEYSGKGKKRTAELERNYLKEQISIFREKSSNSLRVAQNFAMKEDLIFFDLPNNNSEESLNKASIRPVNLLLPNIDIENIRVQAANEIRRLKAQLEKINSIDNPEELIYFGYSIPDLVKQDLPIKIKLLEEKLVFLNVKYTQEDPLIKRTLIERDELIDLLKKRTVNYLNSAIIQAEARIESAKRPKGVLMKYKELIREAARDEITLVSLENDLRKADLEASKKQDPWELITKPTLLKTPVAPSRKAIALKFLILGLIFGSIYSIYREKKSGLVFDEEVLKRLIPLKIISKIKLEEIHENNKTFLFLRDYLEKKSTSSISFLSLEGIKSKEIKSFENYFKNNSIVFYKNVREIDLIPNQNSKYILIKLGFTKISEVITLKNYIELLNSQFQGIIIIH